MNQPQSLETDVRSRELPLDEDIAQRLDALCAFLSTLQPDSTLPSMDAFLNGLSAMAEIFKGVDEPAETKWRARYIPAAFSGGGTLNLHDGRQTLVVSRDGQGALYGGFWARLEGERPAIVPFEVLEQPHGCFAEMKIGGEWQLFPLGMGLIGFDWADPAAVANFVPDFSRFREEPPPAAVVEEAPAGMESPGLVVAEMPLVVEELPAVEESPGLVVAELSPALEGLPAVEMPPAEVELPSVVEEALELPVAEISPVVEELPAVEMPPAEEEPPELAVAEKPLAVEGLPALDELPAVEELPAVMETPGLIAAEMAPVVSEVLPAVEELPAAEMPPAVEQSPGLVVAEIPPAVEMPPAAGQMAPAAQIPPAPPTLDEQRTEMFPSAPAARALYLVAEGSGAQTAVVNPLTIGRSRDNALCVEDSLVSRRHAVIEAAVGGWQIRDLGSSNGTYVNGTRIRQAVLFQAGDFLIVGATRFKLELR